MARKRTISPPWGDGPTQIEGHSPGVMVHRVLDNRQPAERLPHGWRRPNSTRLSEAASIHEPHSCNANSRRPVRRIHPGGRSVILRPYAANPPARCVASPHAFLAAVGAACRRSGHHAVVGLCGCRRTHRRGNLPTAACWRPSTSARSCAPKTICSQTWKRICWPFGSRIHATWRWLSGVTNAGSPGTMPTVAGRAL